MKINRYSDFVRLNEEASPRLPKEEEYWLKKGKEGKKVALYTHDDMDGIFSAIEVKKYLIDKGFEIVKYGILNYTDGWKYTSVDPKLINVVVDFANMPGDERDKMIDYYLDHHGVFTEEEKEKYKNSPVSKAETASAYEAICLNLQVPQDDLTVSVIRMIDSAKYGETTYKVKEGDTLDSISDEFNLNIEDLRKWNKLTDDNITTGQIINIINPESEVIVKERPENQEKTRKNPNREKIKVGGVERYDVSWKRLLDFNLSDMKNYKNVRLQFAAAFNQMLKRNDHKTLISVIHNCKDASIYAIYNAMKVIYPEHNVFPRTGQKKDFLKDAEWRLGEMQKRTRGTKKNKKVYKSSDEFLKDFQKDSQIFSDGYVIINDLVFVPTGTWANALRARTIVQEDYEMGLILDKIRTAIDSGELDKLDALNASKLKDFLTDDEIYLMSRCVDKDGNVWTIPQLPKFILLQYGATLQVCAFGNIKQIKNLPKYNTPDQKPINDLGVYMTSLLNNFKKYLNYYEPDTSIGQDEITVSGGHGGIGSISNIFGQVKFETISENGENIQVSKILLNNEGKRYVDLFKNKIIADLSGIKWPFGLKWSEKGEGKAKDPEMDNKVIPTEDVTKLDIYGKPITNESNKIKSFKNFK